MRIDKPDDMAIVPQRGCPRAGTVPGLSVLLGMRLRPDDSATTLPEPELWSLAQQALGPTGALFAGLPQRQAQVLLHGRAWPAPGQATASRVRVALRVFAPDATHPGSNAAPLIDKLLDVHGDRELDSLFGPGPTRPFDSMPLDLSRAFGGPGHATNPQGRGAAPCKAEASSRWPMPNVEYPDDPLRHRGQKVEPATLGPLGPLQRAVDHDRLEACARDWLRAWPHAAMPARQQAHAPADQCLPGDLHGDETIELQHLHPRHQRLRCRLPGLRPRCLWIPAAAPGGRADDVEWREFALRAHTLWLFPQQEMGVLVYHADVDAGFDPAARDSWLLAAWEPLGQAAREAGQIVASWQSRDRPQPPAAAGATPPASGASPPPAAAAAAARDKRDKQAASPPPDALAQSRQDAIRILRRRGWSESRIDALTSKGWLPQAAPEPQSLDDLLKQLQQQTDALRSQHGLKDADIQRFVEIALRDMPEPGGAGDAGAEMAGALRELEQQTAQALRQAGLSAEQAAQLLEQQQPELSQALRRLRPQESGATGAGASGAGGHEPAPTDACPPEEQPPEPAAASLSRADVEQKLRDGASLLEQRLDGLDLRGLDFTGADLRGVLARQTRFDNCRMQGARLDHALLHDADLSDADLRGASLQRSSCARSRMRRASLAAADCSGADFTLADLRGADLGAANLRHAVFEHADLRELRGARCDARNAQFARCDLRRSDWRGARLDASAWLECQLQQACMAQADARDINLQASDASEGDFSEADLRGSRATSRTRLERARLPRADLREACWEGACLLQADLSECLLDGADLGGVEARQACLQAIQGTGLRLDDADLRGADLDHAKLLQASLAGADLRDASLVSTLCFGADLADARFHPGALRCADVRRTIVSALGDDSHDGSRGATR